MLPELIRVGDVIFKRGLVRVVSRYADGTPEELRFIPDRQTVQLSPDKDKNFFLAGYLPHVDHHIYAGQIQTIDDE